ncbi:hypothetical protein ACN6LI_001841 [Streptomyces violaceoruber]
MSENAQHAHHGHGTGDADGPSWTRAAKMIQDASPVVVREALQLAGQVVVRPECGRCEVDEPPPR